MGDSVSSSNYSLPLWEGWGGVHPFPPQIVLPRTDPRVPGSFASVLGRTKVRPREAPKHPTCINNNRHGAMPRRLYVYDALRKDSYENALFFLPALFPLVGRMRGVVLTAKLTTFFTGINRGVVKSHACCQHADGTNLYYLH